MQPKRFLITGGSQGIGAALVAQACKAGHTVVFTGRDTHAIEQVAVQTGAVGFVADVGIDADNARTVNLCTSKMGGVDVLVNNAGYAYRGEIGALDVDAMRTMFDNQRLRAGGCHQPGGVADEGAGLGRHHQHRLDLGMKGAAGATAYAGSKWAVRGISQCWQAELRPLGIRVTCVCPSEVQTNFGGRTGRNNPNKLYAADIAATIMAAIDMPRRVLWPELAVFANNPWKED